MKQRTTPKRRLLALNLALVLLCSDPTGFGGSSGQQYRDRKRQRNGGSLRPGLGL